MNIIAQDFYFYNNGGYVSGISRVQDAFTNTYFTDIEEIGTSIRIVATSKKQIDKALDDYMEEAKKNGMDIALDESYNFKVEPEGSYWYDTLGKEKMEKENKRVAEKLKEYKTKMVALNIKVLILNLR